MDLTKKPQNRNVEILVIVPAHNEEVSIGEVLSEIKEKAPFADIVVVDDASNDKTAQIAKKHDVEVISLPVNLGIGGAVQTGFKYAMLNGHDIAIQIDGDLQHDPSYLTSLTMALVEGNADIVIGARYLDGESVKMPWIRDIGIRYFSWLTSKIVGYRITDCSSGFRAINKKAIRLFSENYPVDFPDAEALVLAHKAGLRMVEVPTRFRERKGGNSSLRFLRLIYYPVKETFAILVKLTEKAVKIE